MKAGSATQARAAPTAGFVPNGRPHLHGLAVHAYLDAIAAWAGCGQRRCEEEREAISMVDRPFSHGARETLRLSPARGLSRGCRSLLHH